MVVLFARFEFARFGFVVLGLCLANFFSFSF